MMMQNGTQPQVQPQRSGSSVGVIIGIALGAVFLIASCVGVGAFMMVRNSAEESRSSSSSYSNTSTTSASTRANGIGDRVEMDESTWVVVDAKDLGKNINATSELFADEKKHTSGRFIQIHYKVTNTGKKQEMLLDPPKLVDNKSREFGAMESESEYIPDGTKTAILETLQPSMEKHFYTIVEVPADAVDLKVQLTDLGFGGDKETVDIDL
jgi:hypothetical protein